jgi:hypothetical protein
MFRCLRGIVLIAALVLDCGAAFAEDTTSANYVMAGCRAFLLPKIPHDTNLNLIAGVCAGIVSGINYAAADVCPPIGVTSVQSVHIVVNYIDGRPARLNENFNAIALEALRAAWPCKK